MITNCFLFSGCNPRISQKKQNCCNFLSMKLLYFLMFVYYSFLVYFYFLSIYKVAEGATALYVDQLRGIQYITDRGAQQLSVDIEYLSNVLSALSMPIPPVLATFHTCLSTPRDQLKDLVKSDSENRLDFPTANLVCKIRRVNLEQ